MRTLHLLRHAKSDRDDPSLDDHERPLAKRGERACELLAAYMRETKFAVDKVYCSTARRTRETYERITPALGSTPVIFRKQLYLIDAAGLIAFVRDLPDTIASVMVIGHNPGFHMTAIALAGHADAKAGPALTAVREKFPTAALCSIVFEKPSWKNVASNSGLLIGFVRPRDLAQD